jgi:tRNA threonylcarbamoyladenosine biosynthesis protein TsaB
VIEDQHLRAELTMDIGDTHSTHLMTLIDQVTKSAKVNIADVDGFAVTRGPGTFTGLRIGVGSLKGLALATGKPIVGVSSLAALATQACCSDSLICSMIDARREQVYCRCYRCKDNETADPCSPERVCALSEAIGCIGEPALFIGSGAVLYASHIRAHLGTLARFAPSLHHTIRASTVALMGREKLINGNTEDLSGFVPTYLRKSDAQVNLEKQNNTRLAGN